MADESPPLNDINYFTYFKNQKNELIFDEFCKLWEDFDLKLFDVFTHFNILQVFKFMLERFKKLSAAAKEKDKKIEILEMEKSEAIQNVNKESLENTKLQRKINELEYLLEQRTDEEIVEFKKQIKQLEENVENKGKLIQKYRSERDSAEKKLKDIRQTEKETDAEVEALKTANEKLQSDLNAANGSIKQLQTEIGNLQICENEKLKDDLLAAKNAMNELKDGNTKILNELAKSFKDCGNLKKAVTKTLPSKKELIERLDVLEAENNILKEEKYRIIFEIEQKRKENLEKAAEKRRKFKEWEQQQKNGEGSKRARRDEMHLTVLNNFPSAAQQFGQSPVSCSPPDLSLQAPRQVPQGCNNGIHQLHPPLINQLIQPPLYSNPHFQNIFPPQTHPQFYTTTANHDDAITTNEWFKSTIKFLQSVNHNNNNFHH